MSAIPKSPGHWQLNDTAFKRWLIERGEDLMADQLRAHREYYSRRQSVMERVGITEERQDKFVKLWKEFSEPRQKAVTAAVRRKKEVEFRSSAKGEPDSVVKDRAFPKRRVPKGIAG